MTGGMFWSLRPTDGGLRLLPEFFEIRARRGVPHYGA